MTIVPIKVEPSETSKRGEEQISHSKRDRKRENKA